MKQNTLLLLLTGLLGCSGTNDKDTAETTPSQTDVTITVGLSTQTLSHDGEEREYLLYIPESYDNSYDYPVLFNFHGGSGTSDDQLYISDMRSLADAERFIIVYPQGTVLEGESTHWNTLLPGMLEDNKSDVDDFGFTAAIIDELDSEYRSTRSF